VLVGDKGKEQVVNLHFLLSQARVSARPSVLWCYKKELGFTRCAITRLLAAVRLLPVLVTVRSVKQRSRET
jgi:tRNA(Met) C34 N-acetyltransferase TmcA